MNLNLKDRSMKNSADELNQINSIQSLKVWFLQSKGRGSFQDGPSMTELQNYICIICSFGMIYTFL